jgi:hypothetical protein
MLTYAKPNVFSKALMDRSRGSIFASPVVLFVVALAVTMVAAALLILVPAMWKLAAFLFALVPIVITICGLVSCIASGKPANIILLWIIIMILAPLLGPLLWFAWGRNNT